MEENIVKNNKKTASPRGLRKCWPICAVLVLALAVSCVFVLPRLQPEPKHELERPGGGIDFTNPDIWAHTADDGVAIVNPGKTGARPARAVSDPAEIWQGENFPTHGGFTLPVAMDGESIGVLTIPDIGLSARVYEGDSYMDAMERGVWHFRHSSAWYGNISLSAHNINLDNTPGYFLYLYRLRPGAVIRYETALGIREYAVETIAEISEWDWAMLDRTEDNRITLVTCITGRADMRLVVQGVERIIEN